MKDRARKCVKSGGKGLVRRRNPVARALIERAMGERVMPAHERYTRKAKHRKRIDPERE
jgi:hypothetical protein